MRKVLRLWLAVLIYGLLAQGCGHLAGLRAEAIGKDYDTAFYMMVVISVLFLALAANTLAIVRVVLETVVKLMGR